MDDSTDNSYPSNPFSKVTVTVTSNLPCKVCKGSGLVYGIDGKPYLCPKCDGDLVDKNKMTYPYNPSYPWFPVPNTNPYFGDPLFNEIPIRCQFVIC